jgi:hypothetical protein
MTQAAATADRRPEPDGARAVGRREFVNLFGDNRLATSFLDGTPGGRWAAGPVS